MARHELACSAKWRPTKDEEGMEPLHNEKVSAEHAPAATDCGALFFATPAQFNTWLKHNAETATELIVGFHKVGTGMPSMTWPQSVDEALCFGWIDAVRKRIDEQRYQIRFTRRKPGSTWSAINIERVAVLTSQGRMQPAGLAAFALRSETRSRTYAYEQRDMAALEPSDEKAFRKNKAAWAFFEAKSPSYRHRMIWSIVSAKQAATRQRRLQLLIEASQNGERL
jgi:uncharacterized protein YdeI (YjbR/CyaY-like superfamily)